MDLRASLAEKLVLLPGKRALVPTGLSIALPPGFEAQVRSRSGLAARHGIAVLNSPGTIDADYRGAIQVLLINLGEAPFEVEDGDRIAQLVVHSHATVQWELVPRLAPTQRGTGGYGSTGKR